MRSCLLLIRVLRARIETPARYVRIAAVSRRGWLLIAVFLAGCGPRIKPKEELAPEVIAGNWRREQVQELPATRLPAGMPSSGVRRVIRANYSGPGTIQMDIYELTSSAGGLDMVQRWKSAPDTVVFYKDNYFASVKWARADRNAVHAFVREAEQRLGGPS
jgi:hypothetical protein